VFAKIDAVWNGIEVYEDLALANSICWIAGLFVTLKLYKRLAFNHRREKDKMIKTIVTVFIALTMAGSAFGQRPTGTLTLGSVNTTKCIPGWTCYDATIRSPDVIENNSGMHAILAIRRAATPMIRGTVLAIGGHAGQEWWDGGQALARQWEDRMLSSGYEVVQFKYLGWGWPNPIQGNKQGFVRLACRPATIIKWVHDNWHRSGDFMVIGSSQGSAALGYSMAMYGIYQIVDRAVYISGPPMTELVTACLATDNRQLSHPSESELVDEPDGYLTSYGPCTLRTDTLGNRDWWAHNSVETADDTILPGGVTHGVYRYPNTKVSFILGIRDSYRIRYHAQKLIDVFTESDQPLEIRRIAAMGHSIMQSQEGLDALFNILTQP